MRDIGDNSVGLCGDSTHKKHYSGIIMSSMASQITSLTIVYSTIYSGADQRKHQSSGSVAFVRGIHWWPVNSPHKWPVTRKMFPFDEVIMTRNTLHIVLTVQLRGSYCEHFDDAMYKVLLMTYLSCLFVDCLLTLWTINHDGFELNFTSTFRYISISSKCD